MVLKATSLASESLAVLGDDYFNTFAAWELVGQNLAAQQTLLPGYQARSLACAFGWQANGDWVLAAIARINSTESHGDWWCWADRSWFAANRSWFATVTSESGRNRSKSSGNS